MSDTPIAERQISIPLRLIDLLLRYPRKRWDWGSLSKNPNITFTDIHQNISLPWKWDNVSLNINVLEENVINNPRYPWNYNTLSQNRNMTINIIKRYPTERWNWGYLTMYINANDIFENIKFPWRWVYLRLNTSMTYDLYKKYNKIFLSYKQTWGSPIDADYIDTRELDYGKYSQYDLRIHKSMYSTERSSIWRYMYIPIEEAVRIYNQPRPKKDTKSPICYTHYSWNIHITVQDILNNPELPWCFIKFFDFDENRPDFTIELLEVFRDHNTWNWKAISKHPNITVKDILEHLDYPWNLNKMLLNQNVMRMYIEKGTQPTVGDVGVKLDLYHYNRIIEENYDKYQHYANSFSLSIDNLNDKIHFEDCFDFTKKHWIKIDKIKQANRFYVKMETDKTNYERPGILGTTIKYYQYENLIKYNWDVKNFIINFKYDLYTDVEKQNFIKRFTNNYTTCTKNISKHRLVSIPEIKNTPIKWNYEYVSMNPNITPSFINETIDKNWDYKILSQHRFGFNPGYYNHMIKLHIFNHPIIIKDLIINFIIKYV